MPTLSGSTKAPLYSQFGTMRFGATRFGYTTAQVSISIGGTHVGYGKAVATYAVELPSLTIHDVLDETPNTCTFEIAGFTPTAGQELIVTLGSKNNRERLFAGHLLHVSQRQASAISTVHYDVSAIDYTWQLGKLKVTERYAAESATAIVRDLIATYATGFTSRNVVHDLDTIDEITFTDEDLPTALTRLAKRIGGYWYVDYHKDVHFFVSETGNGAPVDLTTAHASLQDFVYEADLGQVITRVYVEGRGTTILAPVAVGDTSVPLETVDMFAVEAGVFVKASFQGADGGAQHLTFTGVEAGGAGAVVGPGVQPTSAPVVAGEVNAAGNVEAGIHGYAYTFVTAAGESLPSPSASITLGSVADPTVAATPGTAPGGWFGLNVPGGSYKAKYVYANDALAAIATLPSAASATATANANGSCRFAVPYSTDAVVAYVVVYLTTNGGATYYKETAVPNLPSGGSKDFQTGSWSDANLATQAAPPGANNFTLKQVNIASVAIGPTGTTQRKVYRTVAAGSQLKLQQTIANNTATTGVDDVTADASLGANVPTTDTSGLTQPTGQINPGATAIRVASTGPFSASGGWLNAEGRQVVRYTGKSDTELTGIPASGVGAITATIPYNSTVTVVPRLTGIPASGTGAITAALTAGDEVYLVVQRDAVTAQATIAAAIGGSEDGIREEWIQDRRLSITEAQARGDAILVLRSTVEGRLRYTCRDTRTSSGKTITVSLGSPTSVSGAFKIQDVTIANFHPALLPTYAVQASTTRYSYEQLLRDSRARSGASS